MTGQFISISRGKDVPNATEKNTMERLINYMFKLVSCGLSTDINESMNIEVVDWKRWH